MTKQEEIREGVKEKLWEFWIATKEDSPNWIYNPILQGKFVSEILKYLSENGVVIKVDIDYGGMEKFQFALHGDEKRKLIHSVTVNNIKCVAVESLIEEVK